MNGNGDNNFQTPLAKLRFDPKSSRSTATKRDSLAAELERGAFASMERVALVAF
jgi:hypothetical protein